MATKNALPDAATMRATGAAMVLVLVVGCVPVGAPTPTETADGTPAATRTPLYTAIVVAGADPIPTSGPIEPGRYFFPQGRWAAATFSFTMPAGYIAENGGQTITKYPDDLDHYISWSVEIVDRLFADPCGPNEWMSVGPTADDFARALLELPGPAWSGPGAVTIGDRVGTRVELTVPPEFDLSKCDPAGLGFQIWLDRSGNKYLVVNREGPARIYAVDVDGNRQVIAANIAWRASDEDVAEFEAIIASIRFEP